MSSSAAWRGAEVAPDAGLRGASERTGVRTSVTGDELTRIPIPRAGRYANQGTGRVVATPERRSASNRSSSSRSAGKRCRLEGVTLLNEPVTAFIRNG